MNNRLALIRADGGKTLGMGHLNRACLLADYLESRLDYRVHLVIREDELSQEFLRQRNREPVLVPADHSIDHEHEFLCEWVDKQPVSLFVIDAQEPHAYHELFGWLRRRDVLSMVVCDASEKLDLAADVVVAGSPDQLSHDYADDGRYLVGPRYFMMDLQLAAVRCPEPRERPERLGLCVGGSDHHDLLFRLLEALAEVSPQTECLIATSRATGYLERLENYLVRTPLRHRLLVDSANLMPLWVGADAAITAGGNTLFERIAVRLPGASVSQIELQQAHARAFQQLEVNRDLGLGTELSDTELRERLSDFLGRPELHRQQYRMCPKAVDGRGLERVGAILAAELRKEMHELPQLAG